MNMVDQIARRNAEQAVKEGLTQMAAVFSCEAKWLQAAGPHFIDALVGKKEVPKFPADIIAKAFSSAIQEHKYNTPPKPANVTEYARALAPIPPMQKKHTDPTPQRRWTLEERQANIRRVEAIQAFLDSQEPEFRDALREHGYGSEGLAEVCARHKRELAAEIGQLKKDQQIY